MTTQHDKPKRWRLRFSVRTMAVAVTLVGVYLACWGATTRQGVDDVTLHIATELVEKYRSSEDPVDVAQRAKKAARVTADVPFVVGADSVRSMLLVDRRYYFWFFGFVAKLPFEREISGQ